MGTVWLEQLICSLSSPNWYTIWESNAWKSGEAVAPRVLPLTYSATRQQRPIQPFDRHNVLKIGRKQNVCLREKQDSRPQQFWLMEYEAIWAVLAFSNSGHFRLAHVVVVTVISFIRELLLWDESNSSRRRRSIYLDANHNLWSQTKINCDSFASGAMQVGNLTKQKCESDTENSRVHWSVVIWGRYKKPEGGTAPQKFGWEGPVMYLSTLLLKYVLKYFWSIVFKYNF